MIEDDIGNVINGQEDEKDWYICCKCPSCGTIFTISLDLPPRRYGGITRSCPKCHVSYNWIENRISTMRYKFIRYWRQRKTEGLL